MARTRASRPRGTPNESQIQLDSEVREQFPGLEPHRLLEATGISVMPPGNALRDVRHLLPKDLLNHSIHVGQVQDYDALAQCLLKIAPIRVLRLASCWDNKMTPETMLRVLELVVELEIRVETVLIFGNFGSEAALKAIPLFNQITTGLEFIDWALWGRGEGENDFRTEIYSAIRDGRLSRIRALVCRYCLFVESDAWTELLDSLCSEKCQIRYLRLPKNCIPVNHRMIKGQEVSLNDPLSEPVTQRLINGNQTILEMELEKDDSAPIFTIWLEQNASLRRERLDAVYTFLLIKPFGRDVTKLIASEILS